MSDCVICGEPAPDLCEDCAEEQFEEVMSAYRKEQAEKNTKRYRLPIEESE